MASTTTKVANKTFRVSRQPQYKRNRASNPLTPLNQERTSQRPVSSKEKKAQSEYPEIPHALPKSVYDDLESMSSQNKSPVVLLVPADRFVDAMDKENISSVPMLKVNYKESRVINKTLSPIGTPERFSNPLTARFQSPLPVICKPVKDVNSESTTQILSVKDALSVINSELSCPVSPPNACSSLNLADSLESSDLNLDGDVETAANIKVDVSPQVDIVPPRLTFFVKSNNIIDAETGPEGLTHSPAASSASDTNFYSGVGDGELNQGSLKPKKILFNSATVVKSKACASPEHSPNTHKTRTFRRRLLQKASLVPASPESNTGLLEGVSVLPVINSDAGVNIKYDIMPPQESEQKPMPQRPAFPNQPPASMCAAEQPILTLNDENNASAASSEGRTSDLRMPLPHVSEDVFPVRSRTTQKKRKSDEYLRDNSECLPRSLEVKRRSEETQEHEKMFSSSCKHKGRKITGE